MRYFPPKNVVLSFFLSLFKLHLTFKWSKECHVTKTNSEKIFCFLNLKQWSVLSIFSLLKKCLPLRSVHCTLLGLFPFLWMFLFSLLHALILSTQPLNTNSSEVSPSRVVFWFYNPFHSHCTHVHVCGLINTYTQITGYIISLAHISAVKSSTVISVAWLASPFVCDKAICTPSGTSHLPHKTWAFLAVPFISKWFHTLETYFTLETVVSLTLLFLNHCLSLWVLSPEHFWSTSLYFLSHTRVLIV